MQANTIATCVDPKYTKHTAAHRDYQIFLVKLVFEMPEQIYYWSPLSWMSTI